MEQNDKHGFALDDEMQDAREETLAGDRPDARPLCDDEADGVGVLSRTEVPVPAGALTPEEIEERSTMATFLLPSVFPAARAAPLGALEVTDAPQPVRDRLAQTP